MTQGVIPMRNNADLDVQQDILPTYEPARLAVERARKIIKENNEAISRLKQQSNIVDNQTDPFAEVSNFSQEDSYSFELYKIKSSGGITDFIKDLFSIH